MPYCWDQIHQDLFVFSWALIDHTVTRNGSKAANTVKTRVQVRLEAGLGKVLAAGMKNNYFSVAEQTRPSNKLEMWWEE